MAQVIEIENKNCPTCSASNNVNPEDVVLACKFCGTVYTIGEQKIGEHRFVKPRYTKKEAESKIYDYIHKKMRFRGFSNYGGMKITKLLIPYWVVNSRAVSRYRGYRRTTRSETESYTDSQGKRKTRTKSVTVYEPVNRTIEEVRADPLICRMGAIIFGISQLNDEVRNVVKDKKLTEFDPKNLKDDLEAIEYLSGEIKSHEAKELVETQIQDEHRNTARSSTTELFDCRTTIQVDGMEFLHYPAFISEYTFGKETYRVLMDGNSGEVLSAEIPITARFRFLSLIVGFSSLILLLLSGLTLISRIDQDGNSGEAIIIFLTVVFGLLAFKANATAWSITSRDD